MKVKQPETKQLPFINYTAHSYNGKNYSQDVQNGEAVTILDEGVMENDKVVLKVNTPNGNRRATLNNTSLSNLITRLGENTKKWVDQEATVGIITTEIDGKAVTYGILS